MKKFVSLILALTLMVLPVVCNVATSAVSRSVNRGDVNEDGNINAADATAVLQKYADIDVIGIFNEIAADANEDGNINAADATMILQHYADIQPIPSDHTHRYTETGAAEPTCTTAGYIEYTCTQCGLHYTQLSAPALGHDYIKSWYQLNPPTCTEDGTNIELCTRCGDEKITPQKATGHSPDTITKDTPCGIEKTFCTKCNVILSEKVIGECVKVTDTCDVLLERLRNEGPRYNEASSLWREMTDCVATVCLGCGKVYERPKLKYSDYEAAEIMLGWVNDLRAEVIGGGTHVYDMKLDQALMDGAAIRSVEISEYFSHFRPSDGVDIVMSGENIIMGYNSLRDMFEGWYNSPGHYQNMISSSHEFFGFRIYVTNSCLYGVQLFRDF